MQQKLTFWEHLDELRTVLLRIAVAVVVFGCVAFAFKEQLFTVVFAATRNDFITYELLSELTRQFTTHVTVAMWSGFIVVFPYILFELFRFISPALYSNEQRYVASGVLWGYVMFVVGVLLSYFLIFPLTFRFLATYQVSSSVVNLIALDSYIGTLVTLSLMMGTLFEMPILCWLFAKFGLLTPDFMRKYRRYAVVVLLTVAAIITPTSDIITLLLVAMPIYLLYELSILLVAFSRPR